MKKLFVLFAFLFLLLLGGGQYANAGTNQSANSQSHTVEKKHRVKFTNQEPGTTIIEEADLDGDHSGDNIDGTVLNKVFISNQSFLDSWYLAISCYSLLNQCNDNSKIFKPIYGQSNPIYITLRVLRI